MLYKNYKRSKLEILGEFLKFYVLSNNAKIFFQKHSCFWVWLLVHTWYPSFRNPILWYHVTKGPHIVSFYIFLFNLIKFNDPNSSHPFFGCHTPFLRFRQNDVIILVFMVMTSLWRHVTCHVTKNYAERLMKVWILLEESLITVGLVVLELWRGGTMCPPPWLHGPKKPMVNRVNWSMD